MRQGNGGSICRGVYTRGGRTGGEIQYFTVCCSTWGCSKGASLQCVMVGVAPGQGLW